MEEIVFRIRKMHFVSYSSGIKIKIDINKSTPFSEPIPQKKEGLDLETNKKAANYLRSKIRIHIAGQASKDWSLKAHCSQLTGAGA